MENTKIKGILGTVSELLTALKFNVEERDTSLYVYAVRHDTDTTMKTVCVFVNGKGDIAQVYGHYVVWGKYTPIEYCGYRSYPCLISSDLLDIEGYGMSDLMRIMAMLADA